MAIILLHTYYFYSISIYLLYYNITINVGIDIVTDDRYTTTTGNDAH